MERLVNDSIVFQGWRFYWVI